MSSSLFSFVIFSIFVSSVYACGGNLATIYRVPNEAPTACYLSHLNYANGYLFNVSRVDTACQDTNVVPISSLASTIFDQATRTLFFTTGSGKSVWAINNVNGSVTEFARLPITNSTSYYSKIIGMHIVTDNNVRKLMVVTVTNILSAEIVVVDSNNNVIPPSSLSSIDCDNLKSDVSVQPSTFLEELSLEKLALTGQDLSSAGKDSIFIQSKYTIHKINFTEGGDINSMSIQSTDPTQKLKTVMDFQFHSSFNYTTNQAIQDFVIVDSYRLFRIDFNTGNAEFILYIPDGPGFPRTNTMYADLFFFSDFTNVFTIDFANNYKISKPAPFNSYFCQGYFQYFF